MAAPGRISKKSTLFKKSSQKIHTFPHFQIFPKMLKSPTLSQHYISSAQTGGPRWCKSEIADRGHICKIFTSKVDRVYGPIFSQNWPIEGNKKAPQKQKMGFYPCEGIYLERSQLQPSSDIIKFQERETEEMRPGPIGIKAFFLLLYHIFL